MITDNTEKAGQAAEGMDEMDQEIALLISSDPARKSGEKKYRHIRRLVFYHILPKNPTISLPELIEKLEDMTHDDFSKAYVLATIVIEDSGLTMKGNVLEYGIIQENAEKVLEIKAIKLIDEAGGKIPRKEFFTKFQKRVRRAILLSLGEPPLMFFLFHNRSKFHLTVEDGQEMISHSYETEK